MRERGGNSGKLGGLGSAMSWVIKSPNWECSVATAGQQLLGWF